MRQRLASLDRRLAVAGFVLLASALLLVIGLVSIVVALNDDNVELPDQGSLEQILEEQQPDTAADSPPANRPTGPAPTHVRIERIGVDAPVLTMGLDAENYPEVPNEGGLVAWYNFSARPGTGSNAVLSGHVDWYYGGVPGEGVFYHLRELQLGDQITVDMEDGRQVRYAVTGNVATAYDDPNVVEVMGPTTKDVLTIITCGGSWRRDYSNPNGGNYSHRVIVRAELRTDLASGQAAGGG